MKQTPQHLSQMYDMCQQHMHQYVVLETTDGATIDGIITDVDQQNVYLAIPNSNSTAYYDQRYYGYSGYPYGPQPPYGSYPPYPGRFRRLVLPLAALTALSVLPWY